jgi:hypothetical protein
VSDSLPEFAFAVLDIVISTIEIEAIEGGIDGDGIEITFSVPEYFGESVNIFCDCLRSFIPKSNRLDQIVTEGIVSPRSRDLHIRDTCIPLSIGMIYVKGSGDDRDIHIVSF